MSIHIHKSSKNAKQYYILKTPYVYIIMKLKNIKGKMFAVLNGEM